MNFTWIDSAHAADKQRRADSLQRDGRRLALCGFISILAMLAELLLAGLK